MSIAGGKWIEQLILDGTWKVWVEGEPVRPDAKWCREHVGPNSVDVSLGCILLVPSSGIVPVRLRSQRGVPAAGQIENEKTHPEWTRRDMTGPGQDGGYVLEPGGFVLGCAREAFDCSNDMIDLVQMYDGRSTCGRLGIQSHMTAGFGDYGFSGAFTLEIHNCFPRPIELFYGMRIGQVSFHRVHQPKVYKGAYDMVEHRAEPVAPKLGEGRF